MIIALVQAVSYIFLGNYGEVEDIGIFGIFMIITQLVLASVIVIMLDELL